MPRTTLRYAIEHLDATERAHYLGLGRAPRPPHEAIRQETDA